MRDSLKKSIKKIISNINIDKAKKIAVYALAVMFALWSVICKVPFLFVMCLVIWGLMLAYSFNNLQSRYVLLIYLLAFFMFLLGGDATAWYFGCDQEFTFDASIDMHAYKCIFLSLFFILIGFVLGEITLCRKYNARLYMEQTYSDRQYYVKKISCIGLYITVIPYLIGTIEAGIYVINNGYLKYYTDFATSLPKIIEVPGELFTLFLFAFLATMPEKKQCIIPLSLYFLNGCIGLMSGRRLYFGIAVFVVAAYIIMRHRKAPQESWIKKKWLIPLAIAAPLCIVLLYCYKYIRYNIPIENTNILAMLVRFFNQQGVSIDTIKFGKLFEGDELGCTSLYYSIKYFRSNVLTRAFVNFPTELYNIRSRNTALFTNCFADYIQFRVSPKDYYAGYGLGTSYIAELYHDMGYIGVSVISMLYGFIMNKLFSVKNEKVNIWRYTIALMILEQLVILPRYGADAVLRPFFNMTKMGVFVCFIVAVEILCRKGRKDKYADQEGSH